MRRRIGSGSVMRRKLGRVRGREGSWSSTRTGGGRGFNLATEDSEPSRERVRPEGEPGRSGWLHTGGRHRGVVGTLFCSVDARSSTENSVVVTTLYSLILTLRTRPPRQGYATVTSVCCLRLNQVSNLPMRDLCVGCSVRGPGVVRRVGGLCPGGVRCGVPR